MTTSTTRGRDTAQLRCFRTDFYGCLTSWADALFELTDAALCAPAPVASVPTLSLEPGFRRSHGSLYKALAHGELDTERLRDVLAAHRPARWPQVFAVDASSWARCEAETSPGRGLYYYPSRQSSGQPIVAGWSYQWITQLNWAPDSWTAPMDARRIPPTANITEATAEQVTDLVTRLQRREPNGSAPVFVFDAGYDPIGLTDALANTRACIVVRLRGNRDFYTDPAPHQPGQVGRPARHGARLVLRATNRRATAGRRAHHHRPPLRCGHGQRLAPTAPQTQYPRPLGEDHLPADRARHCGPSPGPTPAQTTQPRHQSSLALGRRNDPDRPRTHLAHLPTPLRHRAHLPLRQEHPRLDHPRSPHPRTSRPVDLAGRGRLHPTPPRPRTHRRPPAALGTTTPARSH